MSENVERFAEAVTRAVDESPLSQRELGETVARILGRPESFAQTTVSGWKSGDVPDPAVVFAIERALGLDPGSLSRHLGYSPRSNGKIGGVLAAIASDPYLSDTQRDLLAAMYRHSVGAEPVSD